MHSEKQTPQNLNMQTLNWTWQKKTLMKEKGNESQILQGEEIVSYFKSQPDLNQHVWHQRKHNFSH